MKQPSGNVSAALLKWRNHIKNVNAGPPWTALTCSVRHHRSQSGNPLQSGWDFLMRWINSKHTSREMQIFNEFKKKKKKTEVHLFHSAHKVGFYCRYKGIGTATSFCRMTLKLFFKRLECLCIVGTTSNLLFHMDNKKGILQQTSEPRTYLLHGIAKMYIITYTSPSVQTWGITWATTPACSKFTTSPFNPRQ